MGVPVGDSGICCCSYLMSFEGCQLLCWIYSLTFLKMCWFLTFHVLVCIKRFSLWRLNTVHFCWICIHCTCSFEYFVVCEWTETDHRLTQLIFSHSAKQAQEKNWNSYSFLNFLFLLLLNFSSHSFSNIFFKHVHIYMYEQCHSVHDGMSVFLFFSKHNPNKTNI